MLKKEMLYSLADVCIIPAVLTNIKSRSECNPFRKGITGKDNYYPIITAPMDFVQPSNGVQFENVGISSIIPRTLPLEVRIK